MKAKIFIKGATTLLVSGLVLSGCGGNESGNDESAGEENAAGSGENIELELWTTPQFQGVFSPSEEGADYDSFFLEAADRYMEEHPNVTIDVQVIPGDDRDSELSVALQTDTLPDIFMDSHFVLSQWAHEGVLAPLDDVIDEETMNDIPESIWENVRVGDDIYMYPFNHNIGTLTYNADMFREAGLEEYIGEKDEVVHWSVEDYNTILEALDSTLPDSTSPMGLFALNNQGDTWNLNWLRMHGNDFWGENGEVIVNQEDGVAALEQLAEWHENGYTNQGPESVSSNDVNALFQNQQLAVSFANTVQYNTMLGEMERGTLEEFDARLAANPSSTGDPVAFTYVLSSIAFNTGTEEEVATAKDFIKFYSSDEELVMGSAQGVPVRQSVSEQLSAEENPLLEANNELSEQVYNFSNNTPGYAELRNVLYPELQAVFTGEKTSQEALDSYTDKASQIIEDATQRSQVLSE
ncbi:ABC transporter substrate-binding protein [Marinilactibacillus psychrotolerans]|uniref:ABC transporter substrate-binding protein n=1 Tax=Marinilactibacillus psychrotolerans TaxID=191770 RepID=UPI0038895DB0